MPALNHVTVLGNLTDDPYCSSPKDGHKVCTFTIATNRKYKTKANEQKNEKVFVDVVAWDKLAEISSTLKKGQMVVVEGRLGNKRRDVKGTRVLLLNVVANRIQNFKRLEDLKSK